MKITMAEDLQLLRQYAETRAEHAFAALVERHLSLVYSAARSTGLRRWRRAYSWIWHGRHRRCRDAMTSSAGFTRARITPRQN